MKINEIIQELDKYIIKETNERYLEIQKVGPNYPNADGGYVKSPGLNVSLIESGEPVIASNCNNYIGLSLLGGSTWSDESIRNTMKEYYPNITDDIVIKYIN